ncbi:MAG: putative Na+/H+ antiporter [Desulfobacterales bacterium]|nr:putative Na+/H+ antiporter [Desulfobacterales bacterium]
MVRWTGPVLFGVLVIVAIATAARPALSSGPSASHKSIVFPKSLDSYGDHPEDGLPAIIANRVRQEPFNLVATIIFMAAILHTFLTSRFMAISHRWSQRHRERIAMGAAERYGVHIGAEIFHFLGEIEVVFGLWAAVLTWTIFLFYDWDTLHFYITQRVNFTEPMFVVVIMTLAATRPILKLAEAALAEVARTLGGTLKAWWLTLLTLGPMLGSLITEPAAMTICALLLARKFYDLAPTRPFKYATMGLLFVNVSVGGTLSHFAAPPVLMVAGPWKWDMSYMVAHFGWKAALAIVLSNGLYFFIFRRELAALEKNFTLTSLKDDIQRTYIHRSEFEPEFERTGVELGEELGFRWAVESRYAALKKAIEKRLWDKYKDDIRNSPIDLKLAREAFDTRFEEIKRQNLRRTFPGLLPEDQRPRYRDPEWDNRDDPVPGWVIGMHVVFMGWTIVNAHDPAIFVPGVLFFLGFSQVTAPYQNRIDLKPPLLVGFFLGGLVIHGGVQGWWIAPVLGALADIPLMLIATVLTAFNDNAAITYLSTLVPDLTPDLKYAVVAGAVAGGGLTIIANAPNPAGQSILKKYFRNGISPLYLLAAATVPTLIVLACFIVFR